MKVKTGTVLGTHGIKGEIRVYSTTDFADERYQPGNLVTLKLNNKEVEFEIESHRVHKKQDLLKFVGVDDINEVEQYKQAEVWCEQVDVLEEGEYYVTDLIGCAIQDEEGHGLGEVVDVLEMPTQDLLVVEDQGVSYKIPYVDAFIVDEDIDAKVIVVSLIEGIHP